jgi:hypothetical protein
VTVSRHPAPTARLQVNATSCQWANRSRLVLVVLLQPVHRSGVLAAESSELLHGPAGEMLVDPPCEEAQLGAVEGPVVVDPAPDLRVDLVREAGQVRAATAVEVPVPDLLAFRFLRLAADGRVEAGEVPLLPFGQAAPEGVAEEIEAGVLEVSRRFASLQYTIFVFAGCSSGPRAPSRAAMATRRSRARSSLSQCTIMSSAYAESRVMPILALDLLVRAVSGFPLSA